jgi:hypothetical protein
MADTDLSEAMRAVANKRWAGTTREERRRGTAAATEARKSAAQRIAELEQHLEARISELSAEVAELRAERVAA